MPDNGIVLQPFNVDPDDSSPLLSLGKVVTMDRTIIEDGAVYCRRGSIAAARLESRTIAGHPRALFFE